MIFDIATTHAENITEISASSLSRSLSDSAETHTPHEPHNGQRVRTLCQRVPKESVYSVQYKDITNGFRAYYYICIVRNRRKASVINKYL